MYKAMANIRSKQLLLAGGAVLSGYLGGVILLHFHLFSLGIAIFAISLAFLVGIGKQASPWGFNAATTAAFSSGRGKKLEMVAYISAYTLPAAIVWSFLALVLHRVSILPVQLSLVTFVYTLLYGSVEMFGLPLSSPGLAWQVPSSWIKGTKLRRMMIWGSLLGPGFVTRNPYAGMWLLPCCIAFNQNLFAAIIIGGCVGAIHGFARSLGILMNRKNLASETSHLLLLGSVIRWRYIDGFVLLIAGGAIIAQVLWLMKTYI